MRRLILVLTVGSGLVIPASVASAGAEAVPLCFGRTPTIVGTTGNDDGHDNPVIEGTSGSDVIVGLSGADYIDGNGGNDYICGNAGADNIDVHEDASEGNDRIAGGGGPDCAVGSWSDTEVGVNDFIRGGSQNDRCLTGGPGKDFVAGGSGDDFLNGNAGDDVLRGGYGNDRLDDTFPGTGDVDVLRGNPGDDFLFAEDGDTLDELDGGSEEVADHCDGDLGDALISCEIVT